MSTISLKAVTSTVSKKDSSTYEFVDFPKPSDRTTLPLIKFLEIETFPLNRDVEKRAKKAVTRFTTPMHKHCEVDIMTYTGPTTYEPAFFKHGEEYVLDGNTRQFIWKSHIDGKLVNTKITKLQIPKDVVINRYEFNDAYLAYQTYLTIDSAEAYEKKPEKITGAFRAENLLANFNNKKMKQGAIGTAMDAACPMEGSKGGFAVNGVNDLVDQVKTLKNVLIGVDKLDAPGRGVLSTQLSLGTAMLAGVILDPTDSQWITAIERLTHPDNDDIMIDNDGIYWLIQGNLENVMSPDMNNALPYNTGLFNDRKNCLDYIAYCWTQYIDNVKMDRAPAKSQISNAHLKLLSRAWESDQSEEV
jgi:hypothetical protein